MLEGNAKNVKMLNFVLDNLCFYFSLLRTLVLVCSGERKKIVSDGGKNVTKSKDMLPHFNLLICLVARYFDQADLAD